MSVGPRLIGHTLSLVSGRATSL